MLFCRTPYENACGTWNGRSKLVMMSFLASSNPVMSCKHPKVVRSNEQPLIRSLILCSSSDPFLFRDEHRLSGPDRSSSIGCCAVGDFKLLFSGVWFSGV
jgi:hypothetical protein